MVGASEGGLINCASVTSVCLFQTLGEAGSELDTPEADSFVADGDASLSEQILDVSVTETETIAESNMSPGNR